MSEKSSSSASVLVAFVVGALAGAAIALLYAPAPGEETRRKLAEKARQGRDRAQQVAKEGREFVDRQRENLADVAERGRQAFDQARRETQ
jgi:gas vesicle protein